MILVRLTPSLMESLFLWITITCLCDHLHAHEVHEYAIIWNDTMDTNNGWIGYNHFQFATVSNKCISGACSQVVALDDNSWIEKSTNIEAYSNIQLQIDINADDIEINDACEIWYNYDGNKWIKYGEWRQDIYRNEIIKFPDCSISDIIWIRLKIHADGHLYDRDRCYWDNAILRGIISTKMPSNSPIPSPTTQSPSSFTAEPTLYPTLYPTTNGNANLKQISQTGSDEHRVYAQDPVTGLTLSMCLAIFVGGACLCSSIILITRQIIMKTEKKLQSQNRKNKSSDALSRTHSINAEESQMAGVSPVSLSTLEIKPDGVNSNQNFNPCANQLMRVYDNDTYNIHCGEAYVQKHRIVPLKKGNFVELKTSVQVDSGSSDSDQKHMYLSTVEDNVSETDDDDTEVDKPFILKL